MDYSTLFKVMTALMLCQYMDDVFSMPQKDLVIEYFNQAPKKLSTEIRQILKPFRNLQFGLQNLFPPQHILNPSKEENFYNHSEDREPVVTLSSYKINEEQRDAGNSKKYHNIEINTGNKFATTTGYNSFEMGDWPETPSTTTNINDKSVNYLGNGGSDGSIEVTYVGTTENNESTTNNNDIFDRIGVPPEVLASLVG